MAKVEVSSREKFDQNFSYITVNQLQVGPAMPVEQTAMVERWLRFNINQLLDVVDKT